MSTTTFGRTVGLILLLSAIKCSVVEAAENKQHSVQIINGNVAVPNARPYIVAFLVPAYGTYCSGALITLSFVITASHCKYIKEANATVAGGIHDYTKPDNKWQRRYIKQLVSHPNRDIALLLLNKAFDETAYVKPIPVTKSTTYPVGTLDVAGWGGTEKGGTQVLIATKLNLWTIKECYYQDGITICYSNRSTGSVTCSGDSGTPLVQTINNVRQLIGVHYGGWCNITKPSVGNWLAPEVQQWIKDTQTIMINNNKA